MSSFTPEACSLTGPPGQSSTWTEVGTSAANAPVTVTHAAEPGLAHQVTHIQAAFDVPPTTGSIIELQEGPAFTTILWHSFVSDDIYVDFSHPIEVNLGAAVRLVLNAGGAGVIGKITLAGYTV